MVPFKPLNFLSELQDFAKENGVPAEERAVERTVKGCWARDLGIVKTQPSEFSPLTGILFLFFGGWFWPFLGLFAVRMFGIFNS